MEIIVTGEPIVKSKSFCPNPIARYGIPDYASVDSNPKVAETTAYEEYWAEQVDRCINGYWTGGMFIPGRYYYYLNFYYLEIGNIGNQHPDFVDMDYEFFLLVEHCKEEGKGIICVKARRKGLSVKASSILDHGYRFIDAYKGGVCSSLSSYSKSFFDKFKKSESMAPKEFRMHYLKWSEDLVQSGYPQSTDTGYIEMNADKMIMCRTMHTNKNVFKGERLNDCVFEESGEQKELIESYGATKDCFAHGNVFFGTPYVYGTAEKMTKSTDFQDMWHNANSYNFEKFWVPGSKFYSPCYGGAKDPKTGEIKEDIPYLKEKYPESHMRLGMQDETRAVELIKEETNRLSKIKNRKPLMLHKQNNPLTVREAFLSFGDNNYNAQLLINRKFDIAESQHLPIPYILEWVKDKHGNIENPRKVYARLAITDPSHPRYDKPYTWVWIRFHPEPGYKKLTVIGVDGYDIDKSDTSKSLGGISVRNRKVDAPLDSSNRPVAIYYDRPPRKEIFYDNAYKLAVYYNTIGDLLFDAGSPRIKEYIVENGGIKYLAERPRSVESENSKQIHVYGVKFTPNNRVTHFESKMQTEIEENIQNWDFVELVDDCIGYQSGDTETDCDLHDADVIAQIRISDSRITPVYEYDVKNNKDQYKIGVDYTSVNGVMVPVENPIDNHPEIYDPFLDRLVFKK